MGKNFLKFYTNAPYYFKKVKKIAAAKSKPYTKNQNHLPANGHDICNYLARYGVANFQIQTVMKLNGRLDFDALSKAVRLSVDAEPVLGCRFIKSDPPYWKHLDNIDTIKFCSIVETDDSEHAIQKFLKSPLDMDKDPMVKIKVIRVGKYDTLCIKINHACCDVAGMKAYIQLLSDTYYRIKYCCCNYVPDLNIRSKNDSDKLFDLLDIKNPASLKCPSLKSTMPMWKFPWMNKPQGTIDIAVCRLPCGKLDEISRYGKLKGATINDLILTAYYRAMFKMSKPVYGIPMPIQVTVDLRRFFPEKESAAIRNFSGGININLARKAKESFESTLSRVVHKMNKIKGANPGLHNIIAAERIEKSSFHQISSYFKAASKIYKLSALNSYNIMDKCAPVLSNVGVISKSAIKFGGNTVTDAYIIPPAVQPPGLLLLVSSYDDVVTLACSYYKGTVHHSYVEKLLEKVKDELTKGCSK